MIGGSHGKSVSVADWAPLGAERFTSLAKSGFFEECRFFRVLKGFVAQVRRASLARLFFSENLALLHAFFTAALPTTPKNRTEEWHRVPRELCITIRC